ncbi:GPI anchored serine-threonine rich family protein [Aspergillus melleus]|uniref:GPI anchored serine-threonine rich family protein n=1 Tax=Aspergillus melleus TaxID=138277 RepID=UPI001E8EE3A6|nr:uncharacterized protein LDX57_011287 [Aspergillus melleus]KAH8433653.1 hypothetical protein LDX57_011287 [Aspergillus melleus]
MRSIFFLTLSAIATLAAAASEKANPFNIPKDGYSFKTGEPTTLTWAPTTEGTVTLRLQWGGVLTPNSGTAIAKSIPNSGSFTWTPPSDLAAQPDYTVEIISDDDTSEVNYLPRFVVAGATVHTTKSSTTSTASATTSTEASTTTSSEEKTTSTSSASKTKTETPTTLSTATSTGTGSSSVTGTGSGSGSGSSTSTGSSTGSSSAAASTTSGQASSTNSASASASASETTVPNSNAGTTTRVSGAMMALVLAGVAVF